MINNLKGNKKRITAAVIAIVVAVLAVAGIVAGVRATTSSTVPVVPVADLNYGEYLDWQNSITGAITTDAEQNIYLSDTEVVEEVAVEEGQSVHKGDVLLRYDISSTKMNLEKEKINHEIIELNIEVARQNIKTLENTSAEGDGDDFGFFDDFVEYDAEEVIKKATVYEKELKANAKPVNDDPDDPLLGSEDYPYIFLCKGDSVIVTKDFIAKWQKFAKKNKMKQLYFELQTRDKALNLKKAWRSDVMLMSPKYDVEVDLTTGETSYAKINDPKEMAKLLRKILKEIPDDERGAWLGVMMDKVFVTTEKQEKLKERGELFAEMLDALSIEDKEEFAQACAKLDEDTISVMFLSLSENLTQENVAAIDPEAVAGMITLLLGNITQEQISAIDPDVIASFLDKLTAEQLATIDTDKIGEILVGLDQDQLKTVMNKLLDARQDELVKILEDYLEEHKKEDEQQESGDDNQQGSGDDNQQGSGDDNQQGSGDDNQQGSDDTNQQGSGDDNQQGSGDDNQQGSGDDNQQGSGDDNQQGSDDDNQQGSGDDNQQGSDDANQQGSGDDNQQGSGDNNQQGSGGDNQQEGENTEQENPEQENTNSSSGETVPSTSPSPSGDSGSSSDSQLLTGDLYYTSDELVVARREAREKLRDLELDLKESDLKIKKAQKALDEGVVTANMNGLVKTAGNPASPPTDGSPFLTVAGSEGLFVRSGVKESKLGTINEGDIVKVTSWQTGGEFEAEIKDISPYPDTTGMFDGERTETYYPFTANILDKSADLQNGDWVEVSYTSSNTGNSGGAMTIMKAFVREEGNKKYVYVRGDDNKLKKQYIITGNLSDSGYEVIDGLSESDWVAFPYGKNVKDGARTREGTLDELYD